MKKYLKSHLIDFIIIGSLIIVALISLLIIESIAAKNSVKAEVYIKGELVLTIDLDKETAEREIVLNENIKLMVKKGAIKVLENNCPSNYCVNQGYSSSPAKPIICAYYGLYIKLISDSSDIDVVAGWERQRFYVMPL